MWKPILKSSTLLVKSFLFSTSYYSWGLDDGCGHSSFVTEVVRNPRAARLGEWISLVPWCTPILYVWPVSLNDSFVELWKRPSVGRWWQGRSWNSDYAVRPGPKKTVPRISVKTVRRALSKHRPENSNKAFCRTPKKTSHGTTVRWALKKVHVNLIGPFEELWWNDSPSKFDVRKVYERHAFGVPIPTVHDR